MTHEGSPVALISTGHEAATPSANGKSPSPNGHSETPFYDDLSLKYATTPVFDQLHDAIPVVHSVEAKHEERPRHLAAGAEDYSVPAVTPEAGSEITPTTQTRLSVRILDRIANNLHGRRTTKEVAQDQLDKGKQIARNVGKTLTREVVEPTREEVSSVRSDWRKFRAGAEDRKAARKERVAAVWNRTKKIGKTTLKVAGITAGVAVAAPVIAGVGIPVAIVGGTAYGAVKGSKALAREARSLGHDAAEQMREDKASIKRVGRAAVTSVSDKKDAGVARYHGAVVNHHTNRKNKAVEKRDRKIAAHADKQSRYAATHTMEQILDEEPDDSKAA